MATSVIGETALAKVQSQSHDKGGGYPTATPFLPPRTPSFLQHATQAPQLKMAINHQKTEFESNASYSRATRAGTYT